MTDKPHLLVVDDEADIRETIRDYFGHHGFEVHAAGDGEEMREVLDAHPVALVILDLRLPGEDGLALCRRLRAERDVGVVMLTGSADTVDRIVGLELGADDYLGKPFDLRELLARVKSVLRRVGERRDAAAKSAGSASAAEGGDHRVPVGICVLDLRSRTLIGPDGEPAPLSAMEFDLLKAFVEHPNQALTRDQLLNLAHNRDWDPFDRSIDVRVTRLRKKIERNPARPEHIRTVRGVGYLYSPDGG